MATPHTTESKLEREARRDKVMALLCAGVTTTRQIAKALGISHSTAHRDIKKRLKETAEAHSDTKKARAMAIERYERLLRAWWQAAEGDIHVLPQMMKVVDKLAELTGVAPVVKVKHSGNMSVKNKKNVRITLVSPDGKEDVVERDDQISSAANLGDTDDEKEQEGTSQETKAE